MKTRAFKAALIVILAVWIGLSATGDRRFAPASILPRGAVVYAEAENLPALVALWNNSELKDRYFASTNFAAVEQSHLGLKLASRLDEFGEAAGFSFDLDAVASLAEGHAAAGLYDIGKLEFVFVAPMSDTAYAATILARSSDRFTEEEPEAGVTIYRVNVDADRGRQKQELLFTYRKGDLIVATSEKLLVETLANLNNPRAGRRLLDEPSFARLKSKIAGGLATVWVDQTALNKDYYFRHYWLPSSVSELNDIRSGIFSFVIEDKQVVEHRVFLRSAASKASIDSADAWELLRHAPSEVPYVHIQVAAKENVSRALEQVITGPMGKSGKSEHQHRVDLYGFNDAYSYDVDEAPYDTFDEDINDAGDETNNQDEDRIKADISRTIAAARPTAVLALAQPVMQEAPLFVDVHRAAVFRLGSRFDSAGFEADVERALAEKTMTAHNDPAFHWETEKGCGGYRTIKLPLLGQSVAYTVRGRNLFVANNADLLCSVPSENAPTNARPIPASELVRIELSRTSEDLRSVFKELAPDEPGYDIFTDNIYDLMKTIPAASGLEIRRRDQGDLLFEEISLGLSD